MDNILFNDIYYDCDIETGRIVYMDEEGIKMTGKDGQIIPLFINKEITPDIMKEQYPVDATGEFLPVYESPT